MQSIQEDSSKFRVTCNYDSEGVVYRVYLEVAKDQLNMLTLVNVDSCILVERINIRGQGCQRCTAFIFQSGGGPFALHSDSYYSTAHACEFPPILLKAQCTIVINATSSCLAIESLIDLLGIELYLFI